MSRRIRYAFVILFCIAFFALFAPFSHAADPQFIVTWKAQTKVPAWYGGKALVVKDSSVSVAVSAVEQNGSQAGKLVDLSNSEIRWYLKGQLVRKGMGMTSISVVNEDFANNYIDLKVSVEYSDGQIGTRFVDLSEAIPIVEREAVLEYRSLQTTFSSGSDVVLKGYPFFFTGSVLKSQWNIDGAQTVDNAYDVKIANAPRGLENVSFSVWNPDRASEVAKSTVHLQSN